MGNWIYAIKWLLFLKNKFEDFDNTDQIKKIDKIQIYNNLGLTYSQLYFQKESL